MTTCPNCGYAVDNADEVCSKCGFNLKKYRLAFFATTDDKTASAPDQQKITSRAAYREGFHPKEQNETVAKMITWLRENATLVFLSGVLLLVVMSFSRTWGWIIFVGLIFWLTWFCSKKTTIVRYTADERLTQKVNQVGSNLANSVVSKEQAVQAKTGRANKKAGRAKLSFGYVQLIIIFTALVSLIVFFTGSGASVTEIANLRSVSVSQILLNLGGHLLASGKADLSAAFVYLIWFLLMLIPIIVIYNTAKNQKRNRIIAFTAALIETALLCYLIFRMSSSLRINTGILHKITSQLVAYVVSVGTSTYFVIFSSILMTIFTGYNLARNVKQ